MILLLKMFQSCSHTILTLGIYTTEGEKNNNTSTEDNVYGAVVEVTMRVPPLS